VVTAERMVVYGCPLRCTPSSWWLLWYVSYYKVRETSGATRPREEVPVFENTSFEFVWALRKSRGVYHIFLIPVSGYFCPGGVMGARGGLSAAPSAT